MAALAGGRYELRTRPEDAGQRLDQFLAGAVADLSRSRAQALVREGCVSEGARVIADPSRRVKDGDLFALEVPAPRPARPEPEPLDLEVLFEDEHLIVLVKPAGLVVHPAPGHRGGTLVNALLAHCAGSLSGIGGVERPGIVHRLDREVSGVMVAAKHDRAHVGLAGQFSVHTIDRVYDAVVWGVPGLASGTIDRPIGRHPVDRKRMAIAAQGGKRAVTHWRRIAAAGTRAARLEVRLETGRTHQIRVHLTALGNPIIGDRLYRRRLAVAAPGELERLDRLLLHASRLGFRHPVTGQDLVFDAPAPALFAGALALLAA